MPVWRDLLTWPPRPAFEELRVSIHAVNGALIPDSARARCAPFVRETVIPGAGHFLQMEDPAGFNRVLDGVLAWFSGNHWILPLLPLFSHPAFPLASNSPIWVIATPF